MSMYLLCSTNLSISTIIEAHRNRHYSPDSSVHRITVRRKKVLEDALLYFKKGIPQDKRLKVTFVGEPAIDDGGPLREFFHLLIPAIRRSSLLLSGSDNAKSPTDNIIIEFEKKTYFYVGQIFATSITPSPSFLSPAVVDYLLFGMDKVKATPDDVGDQSINNSLNKVLVSQHLVYAASIV